MIALPKSLVLAIATAVLGGTSVVGLVVFEGTAPVDVVDYGVDNDGNGRFDFLVVRVTFDAAQAGQYYGWGSLATDQPIDGACGIVFGVPRGLMDPAQSNVIAWSNQIVFLEKGRQSIAFGFLGTDISRAGVDGPYGAHYEITLGPVPVPMPLESVNLPPVPDEEPFRIVGDHTTASYDTVQFEPVAIAAEFTGVVHDAGVDANGNGLFEALMVSAGVDVRVGGTYMLDGQLTKVTSAGDIVAWIASSWTTIQLDAGPAIVTASFPGSDIRASGTDGPYSFHLFLYYADVRILVTNGAIAPIPYPEYPPACLDGTTRSYRAEEFEVAQTMYWIDAMAFKPDAGNETVSVTVVRGRDMLTVVVEDRLTLEVFDRSGALVHVDAGRVVLNSPGSSQTLRFLLTPMEPGDYVVRATLGHLDAPVDVSEIVVTL